MKQRRLPREDKDNECFLHFTLKTRQTALIPIKSAFFAGVAIIKSDLPIIFLILLLILSPQCVWSASGAPNDGRRAGNDSPSCDPKTGDTGAAPLRRCSLLLSWYSD